MKDFSFGYFQLFCEDTHIPLKLKLIATLLLLQIIFKF